MKYRSKRDAFMVKVWTGTLLFVNLVFIAPLVFDNPPLNAWIAMLSIALIINVFLIWFAVDIVYEFREDSLRVQGGPVRSTIRYRDILAINMKPSIWVGYRLLASRDAIEISYRTGVLGSVIISPENKEAFIEELRRRNPQIPIRN